VRLGFAVVVLLLVYATLYWASLAIPKPLITYWTSVNATGLRLILNRQMLIIWLTSPFNAYEALILNYPPWLYFIATVATPTVLLASIPVLQLVLCRKGMASCGAMGGLFMSGLFMVHSFAMALATSYITALVTWLTLGKPGIGTSIYAEFTLTTVVYVMLYLIASLRRSKRVKIILSLLVLATASFFYYKFLPPTPPHLIGCLLYTSPSPRD